MVLMIAAGLVLRGLYVTYTVDPGFAYRSVAFVSLESVFDGYSPEESDARRRRLMFDLETLPGIEAVASTDQEPLGDDMAPALFRLPGESDRQSRAGEVITASGLLLGARTADRSRTRVYGGRGREPNARIRARQS